MHQQKEARVTSLNSRKPGRWGRSVWGLILAAAIGAAGLGGASRAKADPVDLSVVDRDTGRPLKVWRHEGRLYIAGRPGSRYSLRVTNNTGSRVLVVLSVDGVNIISGETADYDQRGYIFKPYESYDLSGWRKSESQVAAFLFAPLPRSYAALTGRPGNVGVIGMAVFREKPLPPPPPPPPPMSAMRAAPAPDSGVDDVAVTAQRRSEKLGTGHGEIEQSEVTIEPFERASALPQFVRRIDYDSYENLSAVSTNETDSGFLLAEGFGLIAVT
jgi:hypothetical protein